MANSKKQIVYDEKTIQTLDALEHIRLRTGMYIGRIGDGSNPADGIYVMLKEVIDNSVDEFIMGQGKKIVNVSILAWQDRKETAIATARAHLLLPE